MKRQDGQVDRSGVRSNVDAVLVRCEERAELQGEAIYRSIYVPTLTYGH